MIEFTDEIKLLIEEHQKVWKALKQLENEGIAEYRNGVWYYIGDKKEGKKHE